MIRTYLMNIKDLDQIPYKEELLSKDRRDKLEKLKREEDKQRAVTAELLLIYGLRKWNPLQELSLPLGIQADERSKLTLQDPPLHFNYSHAGDYVACTLSETPVGVDIEYFRSRELLNPERILHPEEMQLMAYVSNPNEKKKFFYECWVAKESYLKNLGIGLIVRPRDFMVNEDRLKIMNQEIQSQKGHHTRLFDPGREMKPEEMGTLVENLSYLEQRYVHVLKPGEVRGTDWKFDAGYRLAVCSMEKDGDSIARLIPGEEIASEIAQY